MRTKFNKKKSTKSKRTKFPSKKKVKSRRTKWPERMRTVQPGSIGNCGGFIINPPKVCRYRKKCKDGGIWVDAVICANVCKDTCEFFIKYNKMSSEEHLEYHRKHGVRI